MPPADRLKERTEKMKPHFQVTLLDGPKAGLTWRPNTTLQAVTISASRKHGKIKEGFSMMRHVYYCTYDRQSRELKGRYQHSWCRVPDGDGGWSVQPCHADGSCLGSAK